MFVNPDPVQNPTCDAHPGCTGGPWPPGPLFPCPILHFLSHQAPTLMACSIQAQPLFLERALSTATLTPSPRPVCPALTQPPPVICQLPPSPALFSFEVLPSWPPLGVPAQPAPSSPMPPFQTPPVPALCALAAFVAHQRSPDFRILAPHPAWELPRASSFGLGSRVTSHPYRVQCIHTSLG